MNCGIYKLYWDNNNYYYFGQSSDLKTRLRKHIESLKRGDHHNRIIQRIYNKYGNPIIEVVEFCNINELCEKEQYYIDKNPGNFLCNLCPVSESSLGYRFTEEQKKNVGNSVIGRFQSDEKRKKCSQPGVLNGMFGKKHSEETRNKLKLSHIGRVYNKGYTLSDEAKKNISNGNIGKIKVIHSITGEVYESIAALSKKINVDSSSLAKKLKGKRFNNTIYKILKPTL